MERPVRAHCCGLDSVKQIKQAEALQDGSTQARQETTPKSIQERGVSNEEGGKCQRADREEK